jgi:hypothetical protein
MPLQILPGEKNLMDDILESRNASSGGDYVRLQAGDILIRCLEEASQAPIQRLVEALIVAGPESLNVLREIKAETNQRKLQVEDDMQQVLAGWRSNLESYGLRLRGLKRARMISQMDTERFVAWLRTHGIMDEDTQKVCLQLKRDTNDLLVTLLSHYALLDGIEKYLGDWTWGVFHQLIHQGTNPPQTNLPKWIL